MRFHFSNIEDLMRQQTMHQFQMAADSLIDNYDFRDVKEAIKFAKDNSEKKATQDFDECMLEVRELFIKAINWLEKNGRKV
jgi:hypothetical protein